MSGLDSLFSSSGDSIEITGIEPLAKLCRYNPNKPDKFFDGLELADDLTGLKGVTLYTRGTFVTRDRIARLINLCDNNNDLVMHFKIKRSAQLLENFKNDIVGKIEKIFEFRKNYKVYSGLMGGIEEELKSMVSVLLSDENITLSIFKMKFAADTASSKNASLYYNHTVSVAIFAFALSQMKEIKEKIGFSSEEKEELLKAAFFHNMGALSVVEDLLALGEDKRRTKYYEENRQSGSKLGNVRLSFDASDAIRLAAEYHFERQDFVPREDNKASWMANLITIADFYVQLETGVFGIKKKPSHIVDAMNVKTISGELNKTIVQAMTLGMNLKDIFDFYMEMEQLKSLCDFSGGKHSVPYPMTGFKSPTIFICKSGRDDCDHFEQSVKAVTLIKAMGELKEGKYSRCLLTTPKLLEFYSSHYEDIKKDMKASEA